MDTFRVNEIQGETMQWIQHLLEIQRVVFSMVLIIWANKGKSKTKEEGVAISAQIDHCSVF